MSCSLDYEAPELYKIAQRKACKNHECAECKGVIYRGESYENVSGNWDGDFREYKTCMDCLNLRNYVSAKVDCMCWCHGEVLNLSKEAILECSSSIPGFLFGAGRLWVKCKRKRKH